MTDRQDDIAIQTGPKGEDYNRRQRDHLQAIRIVNPVSSEQEGTIARSSSSAVRLSRIWDNNLAFCLIYGIFVWSL